MPLNPELALARDAIKELEATNAALVEALEAAQLDLRELADWYVGHPDHSIPFAARIALTRRSVRFALALAREDSP